MDVSASFQFVVDELQHDWHVLAPDWRGFGSTTAPAGADCYWFPDYLADLDLLLDAFASEQAGEDKRVRIVGHSMGGNIALLYAGVRPQRLAALVNLEGYGMRDVAADEVPGRYGRWIDELKDPPGLRDYASLDDVARRLQHNNPRLRADRAAFLAPHWARPRPDGRYELAADAAHRIINPVPYRWADVAACWKRIDCPVLWIDAADSDAPRHAGGVDEVARRVEHLARVTVVRVADAGHMLHHDQPRAVAQVIEDFLRRHPAGG